MTRHLLAAAAFLCATALAAESVPDRVCLKCHADQELKAKFQDGTVLGVYLDKARFAKSVHGRKGQRCAECHQDVDIDSHPEKVLKDPRSYARSMAAACTRCHEETVTGSAADGHGRGGGGAAVCTDCHNPHYDTAPPRLPAATALESCSKCHAAINRVYAQSAHGGAGGARAPEAPVCTDCHSMHGRARSGMGKSRLGSVDLCERCHGDTEMMAKYGLSTDVMQTYLQDFHGLDVRYTRKAGGAAEAIKATCVDCHGAHDTPKKDSPEHASMKANLVRICQKCHPGAPEQFSGAWLSHYIPSPSQAPVVYLVQLFYWLFIPFMISGLCLLIALDLAHLIRERGSHRPALAGPEYIRFGPFRRVEHLLIMLGFALLVATGLPQKFSEQRWAEWTILALGGLDRVRWLHRIAGIAFAVEAAAHVTLNLVWLLRGRIHGDMLLERKDFSDTISSVKLALGMSAEKPRFGRYEFRQKFEYWGMLMGGAVMIATGFVLLFPVLFARILPGQFIAAAKVAHSFEAMMALLVIVVWHLYCTLFRPGTFPLDTSIFTGRISYERLVEDHPLEHARQPTGKPPA